MEWHHWNSWRNLRFLLMGCTIVSDVSSASGFRTGKSGFRFFFISLAEDDGADGGGGGGVAVPPQDGEETGVDEVTAAEARAAA